MEVYEYCSCGRTGGISLTSSDNLNLCGPCCDGSARPESRSFGSALRGSGFRKPKPEPRRRLQATGSASAQAAAHGATRGHRCPVVVGIGSGYPHRQLTSCNSRLLSSAMSTTFLLFLFSPCLSCTIVVGIAPSLLSSLGRKASL
jgi:hypothetical protein